MKGFLRIVIAMNEPVDRILRKFLMNDICHILADPAFSAQDLIEIFRTLKPYMTG